MTILLNNRNFNLTLVPGHCNTPVIHGQLFDDFKGCQRAMDRYKFRVIFYFLIVMLVLYKYER